MMRTFLTLIDTPIKLKHLYLCIKWFAEVCKQLSLPSQKVLRITIVADNSGVCSLLPGKMTHWASHFSW
ncbi:MAG: hypothetical protein E3K37_01820 [Candidatus Kuenenia sp.]|nr:hypothetical protein [Candidatus Kuenenia hertensis]